MKSINAGPVRSFFLPAVVAVLMLLGVFESAIGQETNTASKNKKIPRKTDKTIRATPRQQRPQRAARGRQASTPEPTIVLKPGEVPKVEFDTPTWNFGRIRARASVSHEFWFNNTGTGPLEILNVRGG